MTYLSDEQREYYERTRRPIIPTPKSRLGKIGCGALLVIWFSILMLPCALFTLAFTNEINIPHQNIPEPQAHPLLRINLLMTIENRGLQFTRSVIASGNDEDTCIQTYVNYIFWQTDTQGDQAVRFCDCYERADLISPWELTETYPGLCSVP